jgi:glycosyltransferase involved in cell wall biosynthesis
MDDTAASPAVQATIAILTYTSSIETVEATIRSALDFDEILVCDGHSTDGTRELAESLGCRVIDQQDEFLDGRGRLVNEAGVNEQMLAAASHDWVFLLDHDELLTEELVGEIRSITDRDRTCGAYSIPRLYTLGGTVIRCASVYPRFQIRLVHRDAVSGYGGIVHSPVILHEGEAVGQAEHHMLVPQPPLRQLWPKWRGYLRLEEAERSTLSRSEWVAQVLRPQARMVRWIAVRTLQTRRRCHGPRLPLRYEVNRAVYEMSVIFYTGRRFIGWPQPDSTRAWR